MKDLRRRVAGDVVGAGWGEGGALRVVLPYVACPIAAEGGVEDDLVGYKVARDVAGSWYKSLRSVIAPRNTSTAATMYSKTDLGS